MSAAKMKLYAVPIMVCLGVSAEERSGSQKILIDVEIDYKVMPKCSSSDLIEDVLCYQSLIEFMQDLVLGYEFALIERLAFFLQCAIREKASDANILSIMIRVIKRPIISGHEQQVSFEVT